MDIISKLFFRTACAIAVLYSSQAYSQATARPLAPVLKLAETGYEPIESTTRRSCADGPLNPSPFTQDIGLINPTGKNIGGGGHYPQLISPSNADFYVKNTSELVAAIAAAKSGETLFLATNGSFNLTSLSLPIKITESITIAGDRGLNGSKGPLVHVDRGGPSSTFLISGSDTRFTGFRFRGPWDGQNYGTYTDISIGFSFLENADYAEVDNMEIHQWTYAPVKLSSSKFAYVHHSHIHSNNSSIGYGYGVVLYADADVLVEANIFNDHRHAIAGSGAPGQSYEARYNIVQATAESHAFDMHGRYDSDRTSVSAGDQIYIHHNRVLVPRMSVITGVVIRDIPNSCAWITHNTFADEEGRSVRQLINRQWVSPPTGMSIHDNLYKVSP
jgi:hypothetical protein